jgi:hypothetical protein
MRSILIATSSRDWPNIERVVRSVGTAGHKTIIYEADKVFARQRRLYVSFDHGQHLIAEYDDQRIRRDSVGAAWYRRPNTFMLGFVDKAKEQQVEKEIKRLQEGLWSIVPNGKWLNAPGHIYLADNKLMQLNLAAQLGFTIPITIVSNEWEQILDELRPPLIMKMPRGLLYDQGIPKALMTTILESQDLKRLAHDSPFPGIFQQYIPKAREWRITVVGEKVFSVAIYTADDAKDDWRRPAYKDGRVKFQKEEFPVAMQKKCISFLQELNLRFGAFDFIESPDGTITFLEVNPSGQFVWLEELLDLPISQAIADELIGIARQ